ncbi:MAG: hypothetical protein HGA78_04145 [Nitrospirales bacterium]|nr:hypothetical protein [Nitrospirales bacterium]
MEERLELIRRLEKKYGGSVEEILDYGERAASELMGLQQIEERMSLGEAGLAGKEADLLKEAEAISEKRGSVAAEMEGLITGELRELGFQKAVFLISLKRASSVGPEGLDDAEFLFSANPGEPPRPLVKVASGGELSRIMLAMKCVNMKGPGSRVQGPKDNRQWPRDKGKGEGQESDLLTGPLPLDPGPFSLSPVTLIFDEVDAGIGGVTAGQVGRRLKQISGLYQVLCITHLPQIASLADNHMKVEKGLVKERAQVFVDRLTAEDRMEELARMLSGRVTEASLNHARELLELTKKEAGS